ncbi:hypothetical protein SAMN05216184_108136 [Georgenia satyanarayanai]|uniref:SWIM-type domain-containing protein n=1 Tax=Georgenia satyanarayanai TaxID=860221 RepID=A0A2Y9BYY1_9MICO|nr:hypothetical protein [Georgenia satyanarayanai]PYF99254.1 hypothetical protein A8987_108136 [Georgenia satyanarayanai]SSA43372.1 hypothetical protein SAMN05216184_108136 [Georgenia satyanarayanai]
MSRSSVVRFVGTPRPTSWIAIVQLPNDSAEVRVRRRPHGKRWTCDTHGNLGAALCPHQGAALTAWRRQYINQEEIKA